MSIEDLKHENDELKTENLELQSQLTLMQTIFDSLSEGGGSNQFRRRVSNCKSKCPKHGGHGTSRGGSRRME